MQGQGREVPALPRSSACVRRWRPAPRRALPAHPRCTRSGLPVGRGWAARVRPLSDCLMAAQAGGANKHAARAACGKTAAPCRHAPASMSALCFRMPARPWPASSPAAAVAISPHILGTRASGGWRRVKRRWWRRRPWRPVVTAASCYLRRQGLGSDGHGPRAFVGRLQAWVWQPRSPATNASWTGLLPALLATGLTQRVTDRPGQRPKPQPALHVAALTRRGVGTAATVLGLVPVWLSHQHPQCLMLVTVAQQKAAIQLAIGSGA